jgi:hypothetical protein
MPSRMQLVPFDVLETDQVPPSNVRFVSEVDQEVRIPHMSLQLNTPTQITVP